MVHMSSMRWRLNISIMSQQIKEQWAATSHHCRLGASVLGAFHIQSHSSEPKLSHHLKPSRGRAWAECSCRALEVADTMPCVCFGTAGIQSARLRQHDRAKQQGASSPQLSAFLPGAFLNGRHVLQNFRQCQVCTQLVLCFWVLGREQHQIAFLYERDHVFM